MHTSSRGLVSRSIFFLAPGDSARKRTGVGVFSSVSFSSPGRWCWHHFHPRYSSRPPRMENWVRCRHIGKLLLSAIPAMREKREYVRRSVRLTTMYLFKHVPLARTFNQPALFAVWFRVRARVLPPWVIARLPPPPPPSLVLTSLFVLLFGFRAEARPPEGSHCTNPRDEEGRH